MQLVRPEAAIKNLKLQEEVEAQTPQLDLVHVVNRVDAKRPRPGAESLTKLSQELTQGQPDLYAFRLRALQALHQNLLLIDSLCRQRRIFGAISACTCSSKRLVPATMHPSLATFELPSSYLQSALLEVASSVWTAYD